jgi:uncharacterized membrane protein
MFIGPLLSLLPYALGGLLGLIGFILLLIGLKGFADHYNEAGIFNNALYGFITAIVGVVAAVGVFVATALAAIADLGISDWTNTAEWTAALTAETALETIFALLGAAILAFVVLFIFAILTAFLYRRSLGLLRSQSGVGLFGTAGLLLLIGAVLTIVAIGFLLIWISLLLIAIAFFQTKTTAMEPKSPPSPPPPPPPS